MSFYLDTSCVVSLFIKDIFSARADTWIGKHLDAVSISSWVEAEFAAVLGRKLRNREITPEKRDMFQQDFDIWCLDVATQLGVTVEAGDRAVLLTKNQALQLSAPDALHLAIAILNGLTLVTFDTRLVDAAKALSHPVVLP